MNISLNQVDIIMGQHMNPMVTTNQKPTKDTPKSKRKEPKHTTKENHQTTMREIKRRDEQKTSKTTRKQVIKWP